MTISRVKQVLHAKKNIKQISSVKRSHTSSINTMILPTTAFLLTALFYTVKSEDQENNNNVLAEFKPSFSCEPKISPFAATIPILPTSHHDIAKFIDGSPKDCGWVAEFIDNMRKLNPFMKTYFDLVFTDLENFNINIHSDDKSFKKNLLNPVAKPAAFFNTITSTIHLKSVRQSNIMTNIRHEVRHASMLVVQRILRNSKKSISTECYFPCTQEEQRKIQEMINKGYEKTAGLQEILNEELRGTISSSKLKQLNYVRSECQKEYQQYYRINFELVLSKLEFEERCIKKGRQIYSGDIINVDDTFDRKAGDIQIISLDKDVDGNAIITADYLDPLFCAANEINRVIDYIYDKYEMNEQLSEVDAYLTSKFPQAIIQYLFPEFHQYINNLYNRALVIRDIQNNKINENYVYGVLTTSIGPYQANDADNMVTYADYALSKNMTDTAKIGLQTLVDKGYQKDEAYLRLARIEYGEGNYEKCRLFYKRAEKNKAHLDYVDYMNFAKCSESEKPKSAKKYRKKAMKLKQ